MATSLQQRLLTAALLVPSLVLLVIFLPVTGFVVLTGIFVALAAWEWAAMYRVHVFECSLFVVVVMLLGLVIFRYWPQLSPWLALLAVAGWLAGGVVIIAYEHGWPGWSSQRWQMWLFGQLVLVPAWISLVAIRAGMPEGQFWVLILFVLIWSADSAAFFAGRRWGRARLAARVSPGKSRAGLYGAVCATLLFTIIIAFSVGYDFWPALYLVVLALLITLFSVVGDLVESLFKRNAGIKDSGHLLPGHGGFLDRIDSLTAAAPVALAGLFVAGFWPGVVV